ncbi:MAG: TIGR01777 family oxidoreductase [Arenicellales bacterium]
MKILFTGATGFIGRSFTRVLVDDGHEVFAWVRSTEKARNLLDSRVQAFKRFDDLQENYFDAVINLAGAPVADKRWTDSRKLILRKSRIDLTKSLVDYINSLEQMPRVVLSGSAIGYYGSQSAESPLDESADAVAGFQHSLCADWEAAALLLASDVTRVCLLRTGIVLGMGGGVLGKMLLPFKLGLGGPIGDGQQMMSWIHIQDWMNACLFLLKNESLSGPYNLVSPNPVKNETFSKALAKAVHRPAVFRAPCFIIKLAMGEASELLCRGQRVLSKRLYAAGFQFEFTDINSALSDII